MDNTEALAAELGCQIGQLSSTYIGLPLGDFHNSLAVWDSIKERVHKLLALWKRNY